MNPFEKTLKEIDSFCTKNKIDYVLFGGIALIIHGINRTTEDIDINILVDLENIKGIGEKIISEFVPIFNNPVQFFTENFVMPVKLKKTSIRIDFTAGLTEFDKQAIKRKTKKKFGDTEVYVCTIEDLIIYKLFASRYKDLADLESIAIIYQKSIDRKYLLKTIREFELLDRKDLRINFLKFFP